MRMLWVIAGAAVLSAQDFSKIQIEKVAGNYQYTEGPAWSRDGFLLFSDVPTGRIIKLVAGEPPAIFRPSSGGAHGSVFDPQGRLITCEATARRVTRTEKNGKVEVLAERFEGKRFNAPNDVAVRRDGNMYFTDPAFGSQAAARELDFYGVYQISSKGELSLVAKTTGRPNGIALSPKGDRLYVTDADQRLIRLWDLDRAGKATNERVFVSGIEGPPNGIKTDEKGGVWVAAKALLVYGEDGKLAAKLDMPESPGNLVFGDNDFKSLYLTAQKSVYRIRLDVKGAVVQ
jgi:sugar lactone lactonase YvrE